MNTSKTRTLLELFRIMLKNRPFFSTGLCLWAHSLWRTGLITTKERKIILGYIEMHSPSDLLNYMYFWDSGLIEPRVKWLKEHVALLKRPDVGKLPVKVIEKFDMKEVSITPEGPTVGGIILNDQA